MAANIAAIRALVRKDLHDEDSAAYRWTDAVLDRHIPSPSGGGGSWAWQGFTALRVGS